MTLYSIFHHKDDDDNERKDFGTHPNASSMTEQTSSCEESQHGYCHLDANMDTSESNDESWRCLDETPSSPRKTVKETRSNPGNKPCTNWLEKYDDLLFESDV